jgi:hypothetical protein
MRWARQVARMLKIRNSYKILKEIVHLEYLDVDERLILKWILKKQQSGVMWTRFMRLGVGTGGGLLSTP